MKKVLLVSLFLVAALLAFGCTQPNNGPPVNLASLATPPADVLGNANAPVTVIEYSDYQCPICRAWFLQSKASLVSDYVNSGKVRFEFKDFPISKHPFAMTYAVAARCAGEQGKYFEMHDKIFNEQNTLANGQITEVTSVTLADVAQWGKDLGLDSNQFNNCLASGKYDAVINANETEGTGIGVNGTPSFVVGKTNGSGVLIIGAEPYSQFRQTIDQMLK